MMYKLIRVNFILLFVFFGKYLPAQINTFVDPSLKLTAPPPYLTDKSSDIRVRLSLKQDQSVSPCYTGTSKSMSGKKLVHEYRVYASKDGINFWGYYLPPIGLSSYYTQQVWSNCRFDGQEMAQVPKTSPGTPYSPLAFKYISQSDTVYKPGQDLEISLYQQSGSTYYYRIEVWHYDPTDYANTLCVSRSEIVKASTLPPPSNINPGNCQIVSRNYNPNKFTVADENSVLAKLYLPKTEFYSSDSDYHMRTYYQLNGDSIGGTPFTGYDFKLSNKLYDHRNKMIKYPAFTTQSFYIDVAGFACTHGNFFYSDPSTYIDSVVLGKPYLYLMDDYENNVLWLGNDSMTNYRFTPFENYYYHKKEYLYIAFRAPRFFMSATKVKSGLKLEWDNVSGVTNISNIKIIAQNVYSPKVWRTVATLSKNDLSYTDVDCTPGERYIYRLQMLNAAGKVLEETHCYGDVTPNGIIEGKLVSKYGAPLANKRVYAYAIINGTLCLNEDTTDNTGFFSIGGLRYGEDVTTYTVVPYQFGHAYDPISIQRNLSVLSNYANNLQLRDTTIYTVKGKFVMDNKACPLGSVNVLINGKKSLFSTDKYGNYLLGIEEPGTYTISLDTASAGVAKGHITNPTQYTLQIGNNKLVNNIDFMDVSKNNFKIIAKTNCGKPFSDSLKVRITSIANDIKCFDKIVMVYNDGAKTELNINLSKQKYTVEVLELYPVNTEILNSMKPIEVDVNNDTASKRLAAFVYKGINKIVSVTEFGDKVCLGSDSMYAVLQAQTYPVKFNVQEVHNYYNYHTCSTDTGKLRIYDNISDSTNAIFVPVRNGFAGYTIRPGLPNFINNGDHPFQKSITATYETVTDPILYSETETYWAMVQGHKPRSKTFVTKTPELPFFILHDPPGTGSYSYLEKGTEISQTITNSIATGGSAGGFLNLRVGAEIPIPFTGIVVGAGIMVDFSMDGGATKSMESVNTTMTVEKERFATSSNPDFVGRDGDVVVGASLNMVYALTDILKYDQKTCSIKRDTSFVWGEKGFNTTYSYTVKHIRNTLLPELKALKTLQKNKDSAVLIQTYIDVWEQVLKQNDSALARAVTLENKSFSSGVDYEYSKTTSSVSSVSVSYESFLDIEAMFGFRAGSNSKFNETEFGIRTSFNWSSTNTSVNEKVTERTVGFVFSDEDEGDNYSIDIVEDKTWGTIGFRTVAGVSSCPKEKNTQKRYAVGIDVEQAVVNDIPADGQAVYNLRIYDRGETSSPVSNKYFQISVNPNSNLDGAILNIAGNTISTSSPYMVSIPWGTSVTVPLILERGPLAFDYENIEIIALTTCDIDNGDQSDADNLNSDIIDVVKLSAHFITDCPATEIVRPWQGEISTEDLQPLSFTGYDKNDKNLQSVTLQIKKDRDKYWTSIKNVKLADLNGKYYDYSLDVSGYSTGYYFIRTMNNCAVGRTYSEVVGMEIDHTDYSGLGGVTLATVKPEVLLTATYPADNVLGFNDSIAAVFSGEMMLIEGRSVFEIFNIETNVKVPCTSEVKGSKIQLFIQKSIISGLDNATLEARIVNAMDTSGNTISRDLRWRFNVDLSDLHWQNNFVSSEVEKGNLGNLIGNIVNESNQNINYELQLPYWLVCDNVTGTVNVGKSMELSFDASASLKAGTYLGTVVLINKSNSRQTKLKVQLRVLNKKPEIEILANSGQSHSNLMLQFADPSNKVKKVLSVDSNDIIYVFVNDSCRGMSNVAYESELNKWAAVIQIKGNKTEEIAFKFWDAGTGVLYDAKEVTNLDPNIRIGSWNYPLILNAKDTTNQDPNSSLPEIEQSKIGNWVYPNPNSGTFNINLNGVVFSGKAFVCIYDLQGRLIKSVEINQDDVQQLKVTELNDGIYIFKLMGEGLDELFMPGKIIIQN